MFAAMYSTQAILPEFARDFAVTPSQTGLTISVVVLAVAAAGWIWGPVSDRIGRKRSLTLASGLLALPTLGVALAPSFELLLFFRAVQGLCMPGLIIVGVPYVAEVFTPGLGGRAMGYYVAALVAGGIVGRVGVGLLTAAAGWRWALGALAASALFFTFTSIFSFVTYRLAEAPFEYGGVTTSLLFLLWVMGAAGPGAGRLADRFGWRTVAFTGTVLALSGVLLSLPAHIVTLVPALAMVVLGMFTGVTAAQLGVSEAGDADRGAASAVYFTLYYAAGALAGFVPGLAWQAWEWPGVAGLALAALGLGLAGLARPVRPAAAGA